MKKLILKFNEQYFRPVNVIFAVAVVLFISGNYYTGYAQTIRWLSVGDLQSPISERGAEYETEFNQTGTTSNFFSWPAQYHLDQTTCRSKSLWIGCKNFNDPVIGTVKNIKVIGTGPKSVADPNQIFEQEIKLIGKYPHPQVTVNNSTATSLEDYDLVDEFDENLPCDRMVYIRMNTSMGITVTKKVMAFSNSEHGNYFINDYVFKNTGIIDRQGTVKSQTLDSVWFYWQHRDAFAGVSVGGSGVNSTWGAFPSVWGNSNITHSFGENPSAPEFNDPSSPIYKMRAFYQWYGPSNDVTRTPATYNGDWGCPKLDEPDGGTLGSAKFKGCVTLHADLTAKDQSDDPNQPRTTWFIGPDISINTSTSPSQYDDVFMADRWNAMTEGHPPAGGHHDDLVEGIYPITYTDPRRQTGGGVAQGQGYGPYTLAPGDSIHIVFAEAVSGISWEKGREVGGNWLAWRNGTGTPSLVMPDGSTRTDGNFNEYKRAWAVDASRDSIIKTYRNAIDNYNSGYNLPQAPPPPNTFSVLGGGDRIRLTWTDNADAAPHFNGYVIYRSKGSVMDWRTVYEKIFECNKSNVVHVYDDVNASRGFDYFYYIQAKDDGTQVPGRVLYSSLFWTITNVGAVLGRRATPETPTPPNADTLTWKFVTSQGNWTPRTAYYFFDGVSYNGSNYVAIDTISIRDTLSPDLDNNHWAKITQKGDWISGSSYNPYDVVAFNGGSFVAPFSVSAGKGLELVRVVPNPYDTRGRFFQFGDQFLYDRIAFFGLPPVCKLKIFTERGDLVWETDHTTTTGDELWDSKTSSGQIIASGIYILYVEDPQGRSVFRKFVVIR